ncbi:MAG TPA: thioesterase family protein [Acidimicrobiales bacterium]|nr:thioesterase family protein [Acidimicrobiales bacterium]
MVLTPGRSAEIELTVTDADTAVAFRSGDVPVLATPRVLALLEEVCMRIASDDLEPGATSVGYRAQLDHLAPVKVGSTVKAEATLDKIEGRRLTFTVSVSDGAGLVAAGKVTRVVVDRADFLDRAR